MAQVDPNAFGNAFWNTTNQLRSQRQQDTDNQRNALRDMYLGEQQGWAREDRQIAGQARASEQQTMDRQRQMENASILYRAAKSVADSTDPIAQTRAVAPELQKLGIQGMDLNALNGADPAAVKARALELANGLAPLIQQNSNKVQSAQILGNGNIGYLTTDGKLVDTGQKAKEQLQFTTMGGAPGVVNLRDRDFSAVGSAGAEREAAAATAAATAGAGQRAKDLESRTTGYIDEGVRAADALPVINRAISLLDSVSTGGIDRAKLAITNFFGVTGADEAELSNNLGKAVLSQLRATFGAQFTEREGARLDALEAGFGKSTEGNKRILQQVKALVDRSARRGLAAAREAGDSFSAEEISRSMNMRLGEDAPAPAAGGWGKATVVP